MAKKLLFSVTMKDCETEAFSVGGPGGGGKDTSNSGARVRHIASGAMGTCREHRSHLRNREIAFRRMAETREFKTWHRIECARRLGQPSVEDRVEADMEPRNLKIETKENGKWVPSTSSDFFS